MTSYWREFWPEIRVNEIKRYQPIQGVLYVGFNLVSEVSTVLGKRGLRVEIIKHIMHTFEPIKRIILRHCAS